MALELAQYAEDQNDIDLLGEIGPALFRLGEYGRAADINLAKKRLCDGSHQ